MVHEPPGGDYGPEFYLDRHRTTQVSARIILTEVVRLVSPRSAVDLGCGVGTWLRELAHQGVREMLGIEGGWVPVEELVLPPHLVVRADLERLPTLGRRFDLAISLEVAEHLHPCGGGRLIDALCELADVVLFSAAIPGQGGNAHRNEQWPPYWQEKFAQNGYRCFDCIRPLIWNLPEVLDWYAQNTFLYVRESRVPQFPALEAVTVLPGTMVSLVHPICFQRLVNEVAHLRRLTGTSTRSHRLGERCREITRTLRDTALAFVLRCKRPAGRDDAEDHRRSSDRPG